MPNENEYDDEEERGEEDEVTPPEDEGAENEGTIRIKGLTLDEFNKRKLMFSRRAFLFIALATLGGKACRSINNIAREKRRGEVDEFAKKLSTELDEKGELKYIKDPVTGNCFQKDSTVWKHLQTFDEGERELVYIKKVTGKVGQLEISKDDSGRTLEDEDGKPVRLARVVAEKLIEADKMLYGKERDHIEIRSAFRSNLEQKAVEEKLPKRLIENGRDPMQMLKVGNSFQEAGFAVNVINWSNTIKVFMGGVDAEGCLVRAGLLGGMYTTGPEFSVEHKQRDGTVKMEKTLFRNEEADHFQYQNPEVEDGGGLALDIELSKIELPKKEEKKEVGSEEVKKKTGEEKPKEQTWSEAWDKAVEMVNKTARAGIEKAGESIEWFKKERMEGAEKWKILKRLAEFGFRNEKMGKPSIAYMELTVGERKSMKKLMEDKKINKLIGLFTDN